MQRTMQILKCTIFTDTDDIPLIIITSIHKNSSKPSFLKKIKGYFEGSASAELLFLCIHVRSISVTFDENFQYQIMTRRDMQKGYEHIILISHVISLART